MELRRAPADQQPQSKLELGALCRGARAGVEQSDGVVLEEASGDRLAVGFGIELQGEQRGQIEGRGALFRWDFGPNVLTDYLFELAKSFSRFYDKKVGVRVIDASPDPVRNSRLRLCDLTARTLKLGLRLLGIDTVERM